MPFHLKSHVNVGFFYDIFLQIIAKNPEPCLKTYPNKIKNMNKETFIPFDAVEYLPNQPTRHTALLANIS